MKIIFLLSFILNFFYSLWENFSKISHSNETKINAEAAYKANNYGRSIQYFTELKNRFHLNDDNIQLDLAHAYYNQNDTSSALKLYMPLMVSKDKNIASSAMHQVGMIKSMSGFQKEALALFKKAIEVNNTNEVARYNYELLKKITVPEKTSKNKKDKHNNANGANAGNSGEEENPANPKSGSGNNSNEDNNFDSDGKTEMPNLNQDGNQEADALTSKRLQKLNLSLAEANALMEAMKSSEMQYYQQLRKKDKSKNKTLKQDW